MDPSAWKQLLTFPEENEGKAQVLEHKQCLEVLKTGLREALKSLKLRKGTNVAGEDAALTLHLIEKSIQGQTCFFGNQVFIKKQACVVLLNLLRLIPEPAFECYAGALVRTISQVIEQLGRQDFGLLRSFIGDCITALGSARSRPFKLHAFLKFVQLCKVATEIDQGAAPNTASKGAAAAAAASAASAAAPGGLAFELGTAERLSTCAARLANVVSLVLLRLAPFAPAADLEALQAELLRLAAEAVAWAEQSSFEATDSARIVLACLRGLASLLQPGVAEAPLPSLQVQLELMQALPRLISFLLRTEDALEARRLSLDLAAWAVSDLDGALVFPRLQPTLQAFWSNAEETTLADECLDTLLAAARRFGGAGGLREQLRQALSASALPAWLVAMLANASGRRSFAEIVHLLGLVPEVCVQAVDQPPASARQRLLLLALASSVSEAVEKAATAAAESAAAGSRSKIQTAFLAEARAALRWEAPRQADITCWLPGGPAETLEVVLETLCQQSCHIGQFQSEGEKLMMQLLRAAALSGPLSGRKSTIGQADKLLWRLLLLALHVFVSISPAALSSKVRRVQELLSSGRKCGALTAAIWAALGRAVLFNLEERRDDVKAIEQVIALALKANPSLTAAELAAMSYLLPLLVTFSYMHSDLCEHGEQQKMPEMSQVFSEMSPFYNAAVLTSLTSPARSVPNPMRAKAVFGRTSKARPKVKKESNRHRCPVPISSICLFCGKKIEGPDKAQANGRCGRVEGALHTQRRQRCAGCDMDFLTLDWGIFSPQPTLTEELSLPSAWNRFRSRPSNKVCWLRNVDKLLSLALRLCAGLSEGKKEKGSNASDLGQPSACNALHLLEPGDTQEEGHPGARQAESLAGASASPTKIDHNVCWLLSCGVLGVCSAAPREVLSDRSADISSLLHVLLQPERPLSWEGASLPNCLVGLLQSSSFAAALVKTGQDESEVTATPPEKRARVALPVAQKQLQVRCHEWRLRVVNCSTSRQDGGGSLASLPSTLLRAIFASAPVDTMSPVLASYVSAMAGPAEASAGARICSLQRLFAFSMLAPLRVDDLFRTIDRTMFLRLFERYSRRNVRVASLCQLLLQGTLKGKVRLLLPKILPPMILGQRMDAIQDLCLLLDEEAVQSLITPQLPYILSEIAEQPVNRIVTSFMFILERVYNKKLSLSNIVDASLGKVLVLILWNSAKLPSHNAYGRALSAIDHIAQALQVQHRSSSSASASPRTQEQLRKRPGFGEPAAAKKRKGGKGGTVIDVADEGGQAPPEVAQTLEGSFLHVLDILEIILSGNRQSGKWEEYSRLLQDPLDLELYDSGSDSGAAEDQGSVGLDAGRLLRALALLLEMVPDSLHRFAPKLLEFLQNATAVSSYHAQSLPCWRHFIKGVGVQRLKPLIPAVVSELLRLAGRVQESAPDAFQELCNDLLCGLVADTCRQAPDVVASIPLLPPWEQLRTARADVDKVIGNRNDNSFPQRLSDRVAQLEGATQQAVRRAVLESIEALVSAQRQAAIDLPKALEDAKKASPRMEDMTRGNAAEAWIRAEFLAKDEHIIDDLMKHAGTSKDTYLASCIRFRRYMEAPAVANLPDQTLSRLMRALLKFLWESSAWPSDQLLCGQLLGSIGAIDPCRFAGYEALCQGPGREKDIQTQGLGDMELLAKRVLVEFLAPNLTSKNAYAFAAQEILKCLQSGGRAERLLAKLDREDVRETLRPYLNSSYQLVGEPTRALAVVGSQGKPSFEGALAQAAALLPAERRGFFEACLPAVPGNNALALFLMHQALRDLITAATGGSSGQGIKDLATTLAALLDADDGESSSKQAATAQAVFSLVDDLSRRREEINNSTATDRQGDERHKSRQLQCIEILRQPITNRKIVAAAVRCGAHARALQFLEEDLIDQAVQEKKDIFDMAGRRINEADCNLLQSVYRELGEPDGVLGAIRIGPASSRTRQQELELGGRWSDVQACYEEQLSSSAPGQPERQRQLCGLVRCTQNMRRFENSLHLIRGMESECEGMGAQLRPFAVEAAWQLSSWDRLAQVLEAPSTSVQGQGFNVQLGKALLAFHDQDKEKLGSILQETTLQVTRTAASAARESYTRAYQHLLRLHVLSDLGWLSKCRQDGLVQAKQVDGLLAKNLLARCDATTETFSARQLLLSPLRVALQDLRMLDDAKLVELAFVRLCRKNGEPVAMEHPDTSFEGVSKELMARAQIEWGRLLYARGSRHDALRHMQQLAPKNPKARLIGTRWATEASSELLIPRVAEADFKEAMRELPESEAAFFYHAAYLDQLLKGPISEAASLAAQSSASSARPNKRPASNPLEGHWVNGCPFDLKNLVIFTLRGYLQALQRGTKRLHFILNRLLQLAWECCEVELYKKETMDEIQKQGKQIMPWIWYSVLSQLLSRVHNNDMKAAFSEIIKTVLIAYPQSAGWHFMQLLKSSEQGYITLGKQMMLEVGRQSREIHVQMQQRLRLSDELTRLATFNPQPEGQEMNLLQSFPTLAGRERSGGKWCVLIPVQSQMTANIPRMNSASEMKSAHNMSFFPEQILSEKCLEKVDVFRTKEKPKKLTFLGNDGRHYPFLCKAERRGDLRKDSRMMEFSVMVNQLLAKNPDARRRNLEVRTFNVVILSEKFGLIEWVPNTRGMRHIIDDIWRNRKSSRQQSVREVKELFDHSKDLHKTFIKQILPQHPPVLQKWFTSCGDPSVWFSKRLMFSQSQALWCMLGYLVGLGDRHGENILVDMESGRLVHVDFDCLFGKGMLLERPEMVPFRLTQNCVSAMGVTGVEGVFRRCCELTMEVLRDKANTQTLLSVLHVQDHEVREHRVQLARQTIGDVEKKLSGMLNVGAVVQLRSGETGDSVLSKDEHKRTLLGRDRGVGLSVKGQVDELLKAAMCKRNLSEMYVGWQPWL
eukprot:TRINITY_DN20226_c0_g1_i1.p1 TRINITY_DN20226_c0_g1~~TRINITY_DN20226_c0_g1_i1.p1  ORF type:complete len:2907 (-),score=625.03 TRINITY_DN20226_c0_g1_i1:107-8827(-)